MSLACSLARSLAVLRRVRSGLSSSLQTDHHQQSARLLHLEEHSEPEEADILMADTVLATWSHASDSEELRPDSSDSSGERIGDEASLSSRSSGPRGDEEISSVVPRGGTRADLAEDPLLRRLPVTSVESNALSTSPPTRRITFGVLPRGENRLAQLRTPEHCVVPHRFLGGLHKVLTIDRVECDKLFHFEREEIERKMQAMEARTASTAHVRVLPRTSWRAQLRPTASAAVLSTLPMAGAHEDTVSASSSVAPSDHDDRHSSSHISSRRRSTSEPQLFARLLPPSEEAETTWLLTEEEAATQGAHPPREMERAENDSGGVTPRCTSQLSLSSSSSCTWRACASSSSSPSSLASSLSSSSPSSAVAPADDNAVGLSSSRGNDDAKIHNTPIASPSDTVSVRATLQRTLSLQEAAQRRMRKYSVPDVDLTITPELQARLDFAVCSPHDLDTCTNPRSRIGSALSRTGSALSQTSQSAVVAAAAFVEAALETMPTAAAGEFSGERMHTRGERRAHTRTSDDYDHAHDTARSSDELELSRPTTSSSRGNKATRATVSSPRARSAAHSSDLKGASADSGSLGAYTSVVGTGNDVTSTSLPYNLQGDPDMYSDEAIQRRRELFNHPQIRRLLDLFWHTYEKNEDNEIVFTEYASVHIKMAKAVLGEDQFDVKLAQHQAVQDWKRDTGGSAFNVGLKYGQFIRSLFELVDIWTDSLEPEDYVQFLETLYFRVTCLHHERDIPPQISLLALAEDQAVGSPETVNPKTAPMPEFIQWAKEAISNAEVQVASDPSPPSPPTATTKVFPIIAPPPEDNATFFLTECPVAPSTDPPTPPTGPSKSPAAATTPPLSRRVPVSPRDPPPPPREQQPASHPRNPRAQEEFAEIMATLYPNPEASGPGGRAKCRGVFVPASVPKRLREQIYSHRNVVVSRNHRVLVWREDSKINSREETPAMVSVFFSSSVQLIGVCSSNVDVDAFYCYYSILSL